jgi:NlpC/P60 family putative phage cell wall peptidase
MIVDEVETWRGTPYHHQAAKKGIGTDCLGLLRGVYANLHGNIPEAPPPYSPHWGEADDRELLLSAARRHLLPVVYDKWKKGDVLIFRVKNAVSAKHCAIALDEKRMIHAIARYGVISTGISEWESKIAGVFSFPGVIDG